LDEALHLLKFDLLADMMAGIFSSVNHLSGSNARRFFRAIFTSKGERRGKSGGFLKKEEEG